MASGMLNKGPQFSKNTLLWLWKRHRWRFNQEKLRLVDNLWLTNGKTRFLRNSLLVINQAWEKPCSFEMTAKILPWIQVELLKDRMYLQLIRYLLFLIMPLNKQIIEFFVYFRQCWYVCVLSVCVSTHVNVDLVHNEPPVCGRDRWYSSHGIN